MSEPMTIEAAAAELGVTATTLTRFIKDGRVEGTDGGVTRAEVDRIDKASIDRRQPIGGIGDRVIAQERRRPQPFRAGLPRAEQRAVEQHGRGGGFGHGAVVRPMAWTCNAPADLSAAARRISLTPCRAMPRPPPPPRAACAAHGARAATS